MGIARATRSSLITNQRVRVDRRERHSDSIGGSFESWQTIVPRYWVRIAPDQHEPRLRIEPGEAADSTHTAWGARTWNGMTVMPGDRIIDEINNEVYDVLGVRRPKQFSGYGAMARYALKIIKDAECPAEGS